MLVILSWCFILGGCNFDRKKFDVLPEPVPFEELRFVNQWYVEGVGVVRVGQRIRHVKFGLGIVQDIEAGGPVTMARIEFDGGTERFLVLDHSRMELID